DLRRITEARGNHFLDLMLASARLARRRDEVLNMGSKLAFDLLPPLPEWNPRCVRNLLDELIHRTHLLALHLITLEDRSDRAGQMLPLLFIFPGGFFSFCGERVILAFPAVFGPPPFRPNLALSLELMQGGVESALLELESIGAAARGFL